MGPRGGAIAAGYRFGGVEWDNSRDFTMGQ